jgi:hypothetical protein
MGVEMPAVLLPMMVSELKQIRSITIIPDNSAIYVPGFSKEQSITERAVFTKNFRINLLRCTTRFVE